MLWLVTPVYGRVKLTRLCLEQRARMLEELALLGVQARQLVVGDDANLAMARELGFTVLKRRNVLGWRVNEGFEWAAREGGAQFVAFCGSDDWHLAPYFADLPEPGRVRTSRLQAFVGPRGRRLVVIRGQSPYGHAPWVISRRALARCRFRPADDRAMNGVDGSIASGLANAAAAGIVDWGEQRTARKQLWSFDAETEPLRMVDFKGGDQQVTPFERVVRRGGPPPLLESREPFVELARVYPADLVERMQMFYADKEAR